MFDYQGLAEFGYDDNGNRSSLTYYLNGNTQTGSTVCQSYEYDMDNHLVRYTTTGGVGEDWGSGRLGVSP